jgi:peroxiredoxin
MIKGVWIILVTLIAVFPSTSRAKTTEVRDFALLDHQGVFHQLSRYADQKAVIVFVHGNGCPIARLAVPTLKAVREKFADQDVKFLMLNANVQDDLDSIRQEATEFEIDFPILVDEAQLVAESLGVERTCEVFVIDPRKKALVYRGPIDDRLDYEVQRQVARHNYLDDALTALLAGKAIETDVPEVKGCLVSFPARQADHKRDISYAREIAPIFERRCVKCHQDGGIAPFAMKSHDSLLGWAPMIRETLLTKRMPPGQIDNEFGQWLDVHYVTTKEQSTLMHWMDAGSPKDGEEDPLTKVAGRADSKWRLGEPDLIVEIPPQEVPDTGILDYRYVTLPLGLDEEKWVRGYEFYIDNPQVVHHITTSTVVIGENDDENPNDASRTGFAGFAPGKPSLLYPKDVGYRVGPGTAIRASLHYTPNGKAVTDHSQIGLYFRDTVPQHEIRRWSPGTSDFVIPPHAHDHPVSAERTVKADTYVFNLQPHMHFRGKRVSYTAVFPDGTNRKLLSVPNYRFNWQMIYTPKEPIFLPAGTKIVAEGAFDNSDMNLDNPGPDQEVKFGPQSWDEMFLAHMQIAAMEEKKEQPANVSK